MEARFVLSRKVLKEQVNKLKELGLKISYSYKTNRIIGRLLQEDNEVDFSVHAKEEIDEIEDKGRIWFFLQAESADELKSILDKGVRKFVVDNETDLIRLLEVIEKVKAKISLSLRMKFKEHRIGTGKYFVYGMRSKKINKLISNLKDNKCITELGVHIHRKSQNTSEWKIVSDLRDSLDEKSLKIIDFINLGGGLPSIYRSSNVRVFDYIFSKLKETKQWLDKYDIKSVIEPGRFLAAPCINLVTEIIQKYDNNLVVNTSVYRCAMDSILTNTKMLVQGELDDENKGENYLIKGNSPTRDDIFRYKVRLKNPNVGDKIVFLNAGAYNYSTDFFGYKPLEIEITD